MKKNYSDKRHYLKVQIKKLYMVSISSRYVYIEINQDGRNYVNRPIDR